VRAELRRPSEAAWEYTSTDPYLVAKGTSLAPLLASTSPRTARSPGPRRPCWHRSHAPGASSLGFAAGVCGVSSNGTHAGILMGATVLVGAGALEDEIRMDRPLPDPRAPVGYRRDGRPIFRIVGADQLPLQRPAS
jgi:hypothetical protein